MKDLKDLLSFGNRKIPKRTAIFNMGPAENCPSQNKGLCQVVDICYAKKAERIYPPVLPRRYEQKHHWLTSSPEQFVDEFKKVINRKKIKIDTLRFNESGDFWSQKCVDKLDKIAEKLKEVGVKTYTYTARKDLDFSNVKHAFINGSAFDKKGINNIFLPVKEFSGKNLKCIADCSKCNLCYTKLHKIIEVKEH